VIVTNVYIGHLWRGHGFASLLCEALGRGAYVSLAQVVDDSFASVGGWAWQKPDQPSRAPYAANAKVAELLYRGASEGLSLTPIKGLELSLGWMGGARLDDLIVGVSKWSEEHDRLLALLVLYSLQREVRMHHIGTRYPTEEEMYAASREIGLPPIVLPADDHQRIYHLVNAPHAPNGCFYREVQFFPDGPKDTASHWDLATDNPEDLLRFVAGAFGTEPVLWDDVGSDDPVGVVWVPDKQGLKLGVMARERWWDIEANM